jgi:murein L,D-transpeptidase YcbB/YkuD
MKYYLFLCIIILLTLTRCKNDNTVKEPVFIERDTTITAQNAVTQLVLDSNRVEAYIQSKNLDEKLSIQMRSFYNSRNYQYAWFTEDGLAEQTQSFWNLHNQYMDLSKDSAGFNKQLHQRMETLQDTMTLDTKTMIETELELTEHFFEFTTYAYAGKLDPQEMQWHIPRKKLDAVLLLDSLVKTKGENLDSWEPVSQQYRLLKNELLRYHNILKEGEWKQVELKTKALKKGDTSGVLRDIKQNLFLLGDLNANDSTTLFDTSLLKGVKAFQSRFGLETTGRIDADFMKALNTTPEKRIEQMLINL